MKCVLGIDPGLNGALCLYYKGDNVIKTNIFIKDMPIHEITKNGKKKKQIDLYALGRFVDEYSKDIEQAIIEQPSAMPGQGVTSCFNFGFNCGVVQSVVAANFIPMRLVAPATWKKSMGLSKDKDSSRLKASQMFPDFADQWTRVKDDGRAESLLIAVWGVKNA